MRALAIDTASEILSVALRFAGGEMESSVSCGLRHSELLLPVIDDLVGLAGIDRRFDLVACMKGPGSFTGLRIGMATAKGLAAGSRCPLVAVPALDVFASGYEFFDGVVVPVLDAKKGRVFSALFRGGARRSEDLDISPADLIGRLRSFERVLFTGPGAPLLFAGGGIERSGAVVTAWHLDERHGAGRAEQLLRLALARHVSAGAEPDDAGPIYLRPSEAEAHGAERSGR